MDAHTPKVTLETFLEPYTGMKLVGVGGTFPHWTAPGLVHIFQNNELVTTTIPRPVLQGFAFGVHFPLEKQANVYRVERHEGSFRQTLFEGTLAESTTRKQPAITVPRQGKASKAIHLAKRGVLSFFSSKSISYRIWQERWAKATLFIRARELKKRYPPCAPHDAFVENTQITPRLREAMIDELQDWAYTPSFSILMPVYNVEPKWLAKAVESVRRQIYPHWQLCLADDASTKIETREYLETLKGDPRIVVTYRSENGHICKATNTAADSATGEFVALMDNDDELAEDALFHVAQHLQKHPNLDLLYSDEDKIDATGKRYDIQLKPDWSPELLLSYNYINHFTVIRRRVFEQVGRFRPGYEGSQDHDLLLRITEQTGRIGHIPRVLYHWRSLPTSTASAAGVKTYVHTSGHKAVTDALSRRGINCQTYVPAFAQKLGLPCLGLEARTTGARVQVLPILANEAEQFQKLCETVTDTDFVLFWDKSNITTPDAVLAKMLPYLQLPGVVACGPLLKHADSRIASAGIMTGLRDGTAMADAFADLVPNPVSYYFYAEVARNVSALRLNGLLVKATALAEHVDCATAEEWCLKQLQMGQRLVAVGGAEVILSQPLPPLPLVPQGRQPDPYHNANCLEHSAFLPACDSPLSIDNTMVKVLAVAHNLNSPEGAPRYLSDILLGLKNQRLIEPYLVSPKGGAGVTVYENAGVPVHVMANEYAKHIVDWQWEPSTYLAFQKYLEAELRRTAPNVVVANTILTFPVIEAAANLGIPTVWIIHESYSEQVQARLFPPLVRQKVKQAFALATRVIPASHDTAALFAANNVRNNVQVIHNGLDSAPIAKLVKQLTPAKARAYLNIPTHKTIFVAVGTVCERKGQHTLVEAAALLDSQNEPFEILLVGYRAGEPYGEYVKHLIARRNLGHCVKLIPETDKALEYLRAADVFVCTSHMETFSRSVMEALAMGLPILSTPCQGVPEQVTWGKNALMFPRGDDATLAKLMARMINEPELRQAMAVNARAGFDNHLSLAESLSRYARAILGAARRGTGQETAGKATLNSQKRAA